MDPSSGKIDARRYVRATLECTVKANKKGDDIIFHTYTENISLGGVCVILEAALLKHTSVGLSVTLPDDLPPVECDGKVIWSTKRDSRTKDKPFDFNTGIEFIEISDGDRSRIRHLIDELLEY